MSRTATSNPAGEGSRPARKSPLRTAILAGFDPGPALSADAEGAITASVQPREISADRLRQMAISEFSAWLRTQTNKHKRKFQEQTISDYAEAARVLDRWMTQEDIDGDFTACDTAMLNLFFAAYIKDHTQGGTNTRQRNLHHLFKWLTKVYGHQDPWTPDLVRYGPAKSWPSTWREVHPGPARSHRRR